MDEKSLIEDIIEKYFNRGGILIKHILESYETLLDYTIPNIINQYFPLNIIIFNKEEDIQSIVINCKKLYYENIDKIENNGVKTKSTPNSSRLRNYGYNLSIYIDIEIVVNVNQDESIIELPSKDIKKILIGKLPIIVGSSRCSTQSNYNKLDHPDYDIGGYAILNGNEKAIISQERISNNSILIYKNNKKGNKYSYILECRSCKYDVFNIPKVVSLKITNKPHIYNNLICINIPNIKNDIPICIIFRMLGCIDDKEILFNIIDNSNNEVDDKIKKVFVPNFYENREIYTKSQAYEYISKFINFYSEKQNSLENKCKYIKTSIIKYYLPHIDDIEKKIKYTGLMVNTLIKSYLNENNTSDRDSYENKRIDTPGYLIGNLILQGMAKMVKEARSMVIKEIENGIYSIHKNKEDIINETNIHKILKHTHIENILKNSISTGSWGLKTNTNKQGVSQVLNRLTFLSTLSHLRRVATSPDATGKLIPPRKLHNTSWGMMCPSETPEGQSVGLVKNLSMTAEITLDVNCNNIKLLLDEFIIKLETIDIYTFDKNKHFKIFINGDFIGFNKESIDKILDIYKKNRQIGNIHPHNSIYINYKNKCIYIYTDRGRFTRPLLKVINNKLLINKLKNEKVKYWRDLLSGKYYCIDYIDIYEINNCLLATNIDDLKNKKNNYTHCEIHPSLILGVLASCIPFANHNQSPRNTYQAAMGKQAIGINITNINNRYDTYTHILSYPQAPLVQTKIMKHLQLNKLPNGINVIVAIASYGGFNQEDSVLVNQSSVERGLFNSTFYRCYKDEEKKNQLTGEEDIFCKPNIEDVMFPKPCNYDKLEEDGFIKKNTFVDKNDILIGKIMPVKNEKYEYRDNSVNIKNNETGYVDNIHIDQNGDGYRFCKVKIRKPKIPVIGDKFSSRHGQKGTVGMLYDQCDLPFTKEGIVPDIIVNPHAIPSRMTIAQLMECILGKASCELGYYGDATAFSNYKVSDISDILTQLKYEKNGNEVLYNGMNGEQMKVDIFFGPTYYQRLKHMSEDKIHSRSTGPVVSMTRQPAEGRSSGGGLRFGEMERDCMIASGASYFLKERLCDVSDKFMCYTCKLCGMIATTGKNNTYECKNCNNYSLFSKIFIPYSCKLLFQELNSMSMGTRFISN
tara:strand:- start:1787 stop:5212 length:3426 start_codon:yes stop_codon:yes gene_type:complete